MSDETHGEDELGFDSEDIQDTQADEVAEDNATDTEDHNGSESEDEQDSQGDFELDEDPDKVKKPSKADAAKKAQIESWKKKIESGDRSIDDVPPSQKWLIPALKKELGYDGDAGDSKDVDPKAAAREVLEEEKAQERFNSMKDSLHNSALSRAEQESVKAEYKKYLGKGLSKVDALETAIVTSGLKSKVQSQSRRHEDMGLPSVPGRKVSGDLSMDDIEALEKKHGYGALVDMVPADKLAEYDMRSINRDPVFKG